MRHNRKSQAAMEFIMTYGWAILVVLIVIAALVFFGLMDSGKFLPEKAQISPGIQIHTAAADEDSLLFILQNNLGRTLYNMQINVTECNNGEGALTPNISIPPGETKKITVYCGETAPPTERFKSDLDVKYQTKMTGSKETLSHSKQGDFTVTVNNGSETFASIFKTIEIDDCGDFDEPYRIYEIKSDLTDSSTCLNIIADNIIIDFQGHTLTGSGTGDGIFLDGQNHVTIKNGRIEGFDKGIKLMNNEYNIIQNMFITSNTIGVYLYKSSNNIIDNNTIYENSGCGSFCDNLGVNVIDSHFNMFSDNNISSNKVTPGEEDFSHADGVYMGGSRNNTFSDNLIYDNSNYGFNFQENNGTVITDNEINENDKVGMIIFGGSYTYMDGNELSGNLHNFEFSFGKFGTRYHTILRNNIVDYTRKIYYNHSLTNYVYDSSTASDAGTIICWGCDSVTVRDLDLSGSNGVGLSFIEVTNSNIANLTSNDNDLGIWLVASDNVNVTNTTTNSNDGKGIMFISSTNSYIDDFESCGQPFTDIRCQSSSGIVFTSTKCDVISLCSGYVACDSVC